MSQCALESTPSTYAWNVSSDQLRFLGFSYATCDSPDLYTEVYRESAIIAARLAADAEKAEQLVLSSTIPLIICTLLAGALCYFMRLRQHRRLRRLESSRLRYTESRSKVAAKPLEDPIKYHLFLSHVWGTGQDRMRLFKDRILLLMDDLKVFLDVSTDPPPPLSCLSASGLRASDVGLG